MEIDSVLFKVLFQVFLNIIWVYLTCSSPLSAGIYELSGDEPVVHSDDVACPVKLNPHK